MYMFCYIINFIKFRHREIPQFLRTILHIYSRIVIREPPLPRIVLEALRVEAISPSSGGADEFLELSVGRCHATSPAAVATAPRPWTAPAAALEFAISAGSRHVPYVLGRERGSDSLHLQKHNRGWEFWGGAGKA